MLNKNFNLPEIEFIGGSTQIFSFTAYDEQRDLYQRLSECNVRFSVINYSNRNYGSPTIMISTYDTDNKVRIAQNDNGVYCNVEVELNPEDTFDLSGKYIYQIEIINPEGFVEIPGQGILMIRRNTRSE